MCRSIGSRGHERKWYVDEPTDTAKMTSKKEGGFNGRGEADGKVRLVLQDVAFFEVEYGNRRWTRTVV